jgi:hypothetical protein
MDDPTKRKEPDASPPARPKKGGFGEFAEVYRARWAANHPKMRRREPTEATEPMPAPPQGPAEKTPRDDAEKKPRGKDGTRLFRPEDHP